MKWTLLPLALLVAAGCARGHGVAMRTSTGPTPPSGDGGTGADSGTPILVLLDAAVPAPPPPPPPVGPEPLRCGRTYDHELEYLEHEGNVHTITLRHRDGTQVPETGALCGSGCTEEVTRIEEGGVVRGAFVDKLTFEVQAAFTDEPGAGTLFIEVCGQPLAPIGIRVANSSLPGFVDLPQPAFSVPTDGRCSFVLRAAGGFVDIRAITLECPDEPTPPPPPPPPEGPM